MSINLVNCHSYICEYKNFSVEMNFIFVDFIDE